MGIRPDELAKLYPVIYHVAEAESWPSIFRHGLLSTKALLDTFEIRGKVRRALLSEHRPDSVQISHSSHGIAVVRDQKPMDDNGLKRALQDGLSPRDWYLLLNDRVFFWLTEERVSRFINARAYREKRKTIITVDTARLLVDHVSEVELSPINSGCTKPYPHERGRKTFLPLNEYPFDSWNRKRRGRDPIVELAVRSGVQDIRETVVSVMELGGGRPSKVIFARRR